jgi:hypothetical protein
MGLIVDIYKNNGADCTANGISSKSNELCIINIKAPFNPDKDRPAALLVKGNLPNTVRIIPANINEDKTWTMFGGNFAYSSDSRFNEAVEKLAKFRGAVQIHDRIE